MAMRDVLVRIVGEETVSAASRRAEGAIDGVGNAAASLAKKLAALGVGVLLGQFFKSAVEEAAAAEDAMAGLEQAVLNSGTSFRQFAPDVEAVVAQMTRLTKFTDDDLYRALTRMVGISGDAQGSLKNLGLVADLAAFKNIGLEESATIVGKAMNGNVTAFNKLGVAGKDATTVLETARGSFGGFATKEGATFSGTLARLSNNWGEFQEAVGRAILSNESVRSVSGKLVDTLVSLAQWVDHNSASFTGFIDQTIALGTQIGNIAGTLWDAFAPVLGPVIKLLTVGFVAGLQTLGLAFGEMAAIAQDAVGRVAETLGWFVTKGSQILGAFGINVGKSTGEALTQWGDQMRFAADRGITQARATFRKGMDAIFADQKGANKKSEDEQIRHGTARGTIDAATSAKLAKQAEQEAKARAEAEAKWNKESLKRLEDLGNALAKERAKQGKEAADAAEFLAQQLGVNLGEVSARALQMTTEAMERLLVTLRGKIPVEQWQALNAKLQEHKTRLSDLLPPASQLAEAAREAADENARMGDEVKSAKPDLSAMAGTAATLARGFLDAAQATGLLDSNMASALTSVINIAAALPKALAGDASSIVAVVGGLANVITGLSENPAEKLRREVLNRNSDAIARLTREVGNLNLGTSGRTFQGITDVFSGLGDRATALQGESSTRRMAGALALQADIKKMLLKKGISQKEAEDLFAQMGAPDLAKIFTTNDASLILKLVPQIIAALQATEFGQFGQDFQSQLDALTKGFDVYGTSDADNKLAEFAKLAKRFSPALADALSGDLSTPEGRAQARKNLQGLFEKLKTGGLSPTEIGVSGQDFLSLLTAILPLLGEANGVLQNGTPVTGPTTIGDARTTPFGAPGLPTSTVGIETPTITGSLVPAPTTITTTISGGITVINQFPNVEDSQDVLERIVSSVDEALLRRYDALRAAQGQLSTVT